MADDNLTTSINLFAPTIAATPQQPVELEFETPPQAFTCTERREHPGLAQLLQQADVGTGRTGRTTDKHRIALEKLLIILRQQNDELRRGERRLIDPTLIEFFKRALVERGLRALVGADPADAAEFLYGPLGAGGAAARLSRSAICG